MLFILEGKVRHDYGPDLIHSVEHEAGDFIYIEPGVPHEVFNIGDGPLMAVVARSAADEWDKIVDYPSAMPFVQTYQARMEAEREAVLPKVRAALSERDTGTALELRRAYESLFPLGQSPWTGPEPQLSHSALTRRILFLDHSLIQNLSQESAQWIKLYAAEQHLWGAYWRLKPEQIPACIQEELVIADLDGYPLESVEAVYWRAYQLALYVDNQETWQRCKGGDHVRRIEVIGPDDGYTCDQCKDFLGQDIY